MKHIQLLKYKVLEKEEKEYEVDKVFGKHTIYHLQSFSNRKNKTFKIDNILFI